MKAYEYAKQIVERLRQEGYKAYFAGGWVRDYLMGHPSSDIDIAADAPPEKIIKIFKKTIPVGINFGVVVVVINGYQFEVSTFRKDIDYVDGRRPIEIALSTEEEDAQRRDFTINGMFYDPIDGRVIDYVNGREDLEKKVIRTIGDPYERFREDRLRMIRAVRFAYRFNFEIDGYTRDAIKKNANTLFPAVAIERVWQELKKMTEYPGFDLAIVEMYRLGLLSVVFPQLAGVGIEEIKKRVSSFKYFPKKCPAILYLMELFPEDSLEELLQICLSLKVRNKDQNLVKVVLRVRDCISGKILCEDADWVRLYAHPSCDLAFDVIVARLANDVRLDFYKVHEERKNRLKAHIDRVKSKAPLVTSADLIDEGILPGRTMGRILEEAERVSINYDVNEKKDVIDLIKNSEHWPK